MALINDAIENKVATVDWLYNRLKTDGTGVSNVEYTMNISIRVGSYTSSAKVTYVMVDYVTSGVTDVNLSPPYYIYKVKSITNKSISSSWTTAQKQQATNLWNKIIRLYLPTNANVSTGSTSVKSAFMYRDTTSGGTGTIDLYLALSNLCTSTTTDAYISSISIPTSGGIVSNGAIYFVNHSGVELGGNYIGGTKSNMFVDSNGNSIPNTEPRGITYQQFDTLGGGVSSSKQCVTESGVASLIKENAIMPIIGHIYTNYKGPEATVNQTTEYASSTATNIKIIPPWTTGIDMMIGDSMVYAGVYSFLYTNSPNIFTELGFIPYNSFDNINQSGTARAYFGNVAIKVPRAADTANLFEPLNDGWVNEGMDYYCYNTGAINLSPDEIRSGDFVHFYDSFRNRKPYLNPAILSGVTPISPYIEHQVIKFPLAADISNLYYHPTLYNTKLTSAGYSITNISSIDSTGILTQAYSAKIPIVIVPSSIAVDSPGVGSIGVASGITLTTVSAGRIDTELGVYKYAFDADGLKTGLGRRLPSDVMNAIVDAISNATCWYKTGTGGYLRFGTVAEKFNVTYTNTLTATSIRLTNKSWNISVPTGGGFFDVYIKDINLPNFRIGVSRTYSSTSSYVTIASVSISIN